MMIVGLKVEGFAYEKQQVDWEKYEENWKVGMPKVWSKDIIEDAIKKDFVPENIQNNYQNPITREEYAQLFISAVLKNINDSYDFNNYNTDAKEITVDFFLSKVSTTQTFADTNSKYVKMANILGLMEAEEGNKFNPDGTITRESMATMLVNYFQRCIGGIGYDIEETVEDFDKISHWAKEDVQRAYSEQLFGSVFRQGAERVYDTKEVFNPQMFLTREEAIVMLNEMISYEELNYLPLRGYLPINIDELMSGFDIDGDTIKMRKGGYDNKEYASKKYNDYQYFRKTSLILNYDTERLNAFFLFPETGRDEKIDNEYLTRVVKGEYAYKEYDAFIVEYNKDGYGTIVTKKQDYGKFLGENRLRNIKDNTIIQLKEVEKDEHPTLIKPALNEEEKQTFLGTMLNVYPQQWMIPQPDGSKKHSDSKPIGTKIGYALETDTVVTLNGKVVNSYNIGGKIAVELDALKDFGYTYEIVDDNYTITNGPTRGQTRYIGQINLYMPDEAKLKQFNEKVEEKPSSINGKVAYDLIGDQYSIVIYNKGETETRGGMRCIASTTGKRFILIDELWNAMRFYYGKVGLPNSDRLLASLYKVEGSPYDFVSFKNNDLAIVDKTNPKHFKVDLLSQQEFSKLNQYALAKKYPQMLDQIFSPEDVKAWYVAEEIVKNVIKPNMSDKQKSDALAEVLRNHGYYLYSYVSTNGLGYGNFDTPYEALVEKYSNASGWFEAFRMCYTIAGLDVYPEYGSEIWEKAFNYKNSSNQIAVKIDEKWELVYFLPSIYYIEN